MTDNRRSEEDRRDRVPSTWERHFSTIATTLILAAMMFTGGTLYAFGNKLTEVVVRSDYTNVQLTTMSEQLRSDRLDRVNRLDFVELRERVRTLERTHRAQ